MSPPLISTLHNASALSLRTLLHLSFFALYPFTATASKLPHNADTTQQNVDFLLCVSELFRCLTEESKSRLSGAHVFPHIFELVHRQGRDTTPRRTSACHRLGSTGGTWQRPGFLLGIHSSWKAQEKSNGRLFDSSSPPRRAQTSGVNRVHFGECSTLRSWFHLCCARSGLSPFLFSQTLDLCVLKAALLRTAFAYPRLQDSSTSYLLLPSSRSAAPWTRVPKETPCRRWRLCDSPVLNLDRLRDCNAHRIGWSA